MWLLRGRLDRVQNKRNRSGIATHCSNLLPCCWVVLYWDRPATPPGMHGKPATDCASKNLSLWRPVGPTLVLPPHSSELLPHRAPEAPFLGAQCVAGTCMPYARRTMLQVDLNEAPGAPPPKNQKGSSTSGATAPTSRPGTGPWNRRRIRVNDGVAH